MSLLRNVLRKNSASTNDAPSGLSQNSKESLIASTLKKSADAISLKSAGGISVHSVRSIAESVSSFASGLLNGKRVPKRRRPDVSRLGLPKWYNKDPPGPEEMLGTEKVDPTSRPYSCTHAFPLKPVDAKDGDEPYCCLVLYSYADSSATHAKYYDGTVIRGELRLTLPKPDPISSLDIWVIGSTQSVFSVNDRPVVRYHVNLWNHKEATGPLSGKLPTNRTLIFQAVRIPRLSERRRAAEARLDSTFSSLMSPFPPADVRIAERHQNPSSSSVPTSCHSGCPSFRFSEVGAFSGEVKYYMGIDVKRSGMMSFDDAWKIPFFYYQLRQPTLREPTAFPFISDREDWPYNREEIGGWTITPFGGRGRFRDETVEIEGLLGVQAPEVYAPGQTLRWSVLLWSKNIPALEAISDPACNCIDVVLLRSTMYGRDVLQPKNAARRNRNLQRVSQGRVWKTDDGPPGDDVFPLLRGPPQTSGWANRGATAEKGDEGSRQVPKSPTITSPKRSRFQDVITAGDDEDEMRDQLVGIPEEHPAGVAETEVTEADAKRSPSPVSSVEDLPDFPDMAPQEATIRLDGDIRIPVNLGPSFRYMWMGREVTFTHPEYSHISPSAPGIYAETPIWLVTGMPKSFGGEQPDRSQPGNPQDESYLRDLPIVGDAIPLGTDPLYADLGKGAYSVQERPALEAQRVVTF
ncbi:uncharacterized protein PHACADRAFT_31568 [Phanerochaete carnosa HHB-10118-sp]|uniref:Arrestin-like N-terminal domain-containing protein n=1 Tax=Phanerochaete carnosa (strain HHB-10118-sp) TaxID=650164 RepID=K5UPN2_PHACS|nr:uncharacterized protein PHACADRAFT_31568 [Phanerochaete carnosa HHB-10118-sp]EKM51751.1 hypothetical protein PHACADRAFT_31568 [Phanerochaete carnosa HHB-10118-sp]